MESAMMCDMRKQQASVWEIHAVEAEARRAHMPLLLLADESPEMIERYLMRGDMYVLTENGETLAQCIVINEGDGVLELKSISVLPERQGQGYGRMLIMDMIARYRGAYHTMIVGTGDSPISVPFYEACGFARSHVIEDFFIDNYDHPMVEGGVLLKDMVYLKRSLTN